MVYQPEKRIKLMDQIRLNLLQKTHVQDRELAKQIAREWVRRVRN